MLQFYVYWKYTKTWNYYREAVTLTVPSTIIYDFCVFKLRMKDFKDFKPRNLRLFRGKVKGKWWSLKVFSSILDTIRSKSLTIMQPNMMPTEGGVPEDKTPDVPHCQPQVPVLAELLCSEPTDPSLLDSERSADEECEEGCQSFFDPAILNHPQVMKRLKALESMMKQPKNYFASNPQNDITPYMRKVVASWMLEVRIVFLVKNPHSIVHYSIDLSRYFHTKLVSGFI